MVDELLNLQSSMLPIIIIWIRYYFSSQFTIVVPSNLQPPTNAKPASDKSSSTDMTETVSIQIANHNYTDCCTNSNVTSSCMGFCSLKNILDGTTGQDPEQCEADFPAIVKCMAGKSNYENLERNLYDTLTSNSSMLNVFPYGQIKCLNRWH